MVVEIKTVGRFGGGGEGWLRSFQFVIHLIKVYCWSISNFLFKQIPLKFETFIIFENV